MIQIITYNRNKYKDFSEEKYKVSQFGEIQALDDFEMCIIDLALKDLWYFKGDSPTNLNSFHDLLTLKEAIINRKKSNILIIFPQNETMHYNYNHHYDGTSGYDASIQIKDNKNNVIQIICKWLYELENLKIAYERTNTKINDNILNADFNFIDVDTTKFEPVTYSNNSNKITTIKKENIFLTTLNISKEEKNINVFIKTYCKSDKEKEIIPEWINNINFYNDEELNKKKEENILKIKEIENNNRQLDKELEKNLEVKSILYTNGDELVKVVLEILDEILEYDSSKFVDEGREDFLIKKEDVTFVGEIKGVSSAVENKNVSQLDVHVQSYLDEIQTEETDENVKGLLIINHQRNKPIEERQKVHEHQIKLAKRNESLIIETRTLLRLFEELLRERITMEDCERLFTTKTGLLEEKDFKHKD